MKTDAYKKGNFSKTWVECKVMKSFKLLTVSNAG